VGLLIERKEDRDKGKWVIVMVYVSLHGLSHLPVYGPEPGETAREHLKERIDDASEDVGYLMMTYTDALSFGIFTEEDEQV
jgi:hypothetical protein